MDHYPINVNKTRSKPARGRRSATVSAVAGVVSSPRAFGPPALGISLSLALGWSTLTLANPQGGQIVAGSASIEQSAPSRLDVIQHSEKAIIDWRRFNIDPSEHTNFQQPSASAAALNRVTGGDASRILGRLTANGRIFLVNPNGVFFGQDSHVDVAGLVATTADIRNRNFLDGRYVFDEPSDKPNASVVNQGRIDVAEQGFAVLAAPHVRNEGLIQARLGTVALAGTNTFTLDFEGDGLLTFEVGSDVSRTPLDEDGQPVEALVSNLGTIAANGGTVALTARAADAVVDSVINLNGLVQAQAVAQRGGEIVLSGGDSGIVEVAGDIDVSGREAGQSGGTVKVLGHKVGLFDGAHIDASGDTGGGEVLVGGNFRGEGPEPNARRTYVARDASIEADGISKGDGGRVIIWADEATGFNGAISARGGAESGNGGFVEVSGKKDLSFRGKVDLTVADGDAGTLLLDPENITIVNGSSGADDSELDDNQILADDSPGATFTISEQALEALPVDADIVLQATNDITIEDLTDDELTFAPGPGGSITFTMNADGLAGGSFVMAPGDTIRASTRDVTISAGDAVALIVDLTQATIGAIDTSGPNGGNVTVQAHGNVIIGDISSVGTGPGGTGGSVNISSLQRAVDTTAGVIESNAVLAGDVTVQAQGNVSTGDVNSLGQGGPGGVISISSTQGSVDTSAGALESVGSGGGDITVAAQGNVTTGDISSGGFVTLGGIGDGGNISINSSQGTVDTTAGTLDASSTGGVGGAVAVEALQGITAGAIDATGEVGGGSINIASLQGAVDTTAGALESFSDGVGGAIALEAAGDIATGLIRSRSFGAASGGSIGLNSGGALDTTGGVLESSSSGGDGGAITLTTQGGNIATALVISEALGDTGTGGDITVTVNGTSGSIDTTAGDLRSSSSGGSAGAIALATQGGNISTGVVHSRALGSTGAGGDITITVDGATGSIDTTAGDLVASSFGGVGGAITLTTQGGNISTGDVLSQGIFGGTGDGGDITLFVTGGSGSIDTATLTSTSFGGDGGAITLRTQDGNINADALLTNSNPDVDGFGGAVTVEANGDIATNNIQSRGPLGGGDISITSSGGLINTTAAFLDSVSTRGVGGAIALEAADGIAAGAITSTGAAGSGDIVLVGEEIDLLGGAGSVQATNARLTLQPSVDDTDIAVGGADNTTPALDLTSADLAALADGFASITIGRNDGAGTISIDPAGISLNAPLILLSPSAGGSIVANGPMQTIGSLRATAPTIGLQDVTSSDFQSYTGAVTFNSNYVTGGGAFTVQGNSTLASDTSVTTGGGDVNFLGGLEGPGALTIAAGAGDILFQGDVGAQILLALVSVQSARDITLGGQFVAGPSEFFYNGVLTSPDPSLQVDSLFVDPDAIAATLFGSVGGLTGREAALAVQGPSGDPDFTINGFLMGSSEPVVLVQPDALTAAEPTTETAEEIAVAIQDVYPVEEPSLELEYVEAAEFASVEFQPTFPVRFTPKFSMSKFTMNATIRGGWPFVVDYQLERPGEVRLEIAAEGVNPFTVELDGTIDRRTAVVTIPQRFGAAVKPASISVTALEAGGTDTVPLKLYGLGAGPKAVGSVAIDSIYFGPPFIRAPLGQAADYRFRSQSAFDNVIVDFCKVTETTSEHIYRSVQYHPFKQGIEENDWIGKYEPRRWNGLNGKGTVSPGLHKLQVRAWDDGEEWVSAWSDVFLTVSK